ncbi:hypothetical protein F383_08884 [Gossypium arboreum]|uniref:Uncharacterized protein n=1 Tax=Gossypium arboreum TaxID=29729 RepID=A0A0B0PEM2_GOSAR|nr:hypothetical protein F383_08884 [Gossypium arboreum]
MLSFPLPSKSQRFYGVRRYRSFQVNLFTPLKTLCCDYMGCLVRQS